MCSSDTSSVSTRITEAQGRRNVTHRYSPPLRQEIRITKVCDQVGFQKGHPVACWDADPDKLNCSG